MPTKRFIPKPDFSRDCESPDEEPEDPSLSGGLNATESDEHLEQHSVRTDSECEQQQEDEEGEEEEVDEGEQAPDDCNDDSSEISSEDSDAFLMAKPHGDGGTPRD